MPRRKKGEPPQMRRLAAKNLAYVFLDGKRHYLGPWNSPEARRRFRKLLEGWEASQNASARLYTPRGPYVTVADLVAAFLSHASVYYRHPDGTPTKGEVAFVWAAKELCARYASRPAAEFEPADLRKLVAVWSVSAVSWAKVKRTWSRTAVNIALKKVKAIFSWGAEQGYVPETVSAVLDKVRGLPAHRSAAPERPAVKPVPFDVLWRSFEHLPEVAAVMALVQLRCGCRPGEVCRMRGDELHRSGRVTFKDTTVRVPAGCWLFAPGRHKNSWRGKVAAYVIGPRLQTLLAPLLAEHGSGPLFPSRVDPSRGLHVQSYRKMTARHGWHPNQLRHNFLSRRDRQAGLEGARQSVLHSSTQTTAIYVQRDLDGAAAAAGRWD